MIRRAARAAIVVVGALLVASPAQAHGNANLGDFYQGLLQPLYHPEFLFGALGIALWSTQQEGRAPFATGAAFAAGVVAGGIASFSGVGGAGAPWGPRLCMLVVGPLVAARVRLPLPVCVALAAAAGLAQGQAATAGELDHLTRPVLWTAGLGSGAGLLGVYANEATVRFPAFWMQVGVRVAGSWIAAIGLLVSAMAMRGR